MEMFRNENNIGHCRPYNIHSITLTLTLSIKKEHGNFLFGFSNLDIHIHNFHDPQLTNIPRYFVFSFISLHTFNKPICTKVLLLSDDVSPLSIILKRNLLLIDMEKSLRPFRSNEHRFG